VHENCDNRQLPGVGGHDDDDSDNLHRVHDPGNSPPLCELGKGLDVTRDPSCEDAGFRGGVVGKAKPMKMRECPNTKAQQHGFGDPNETLVNNLTQKD
jgi:hypothetical protein